MTVESDMYDCLKGLVGNRCYPDVAKSGSALPFIVFQQVGGESPSFLENALPSKKNGRFQITVWSLLRSEAASIGRQAEAAMVAETDYQARPLGDFVAVYDEDTEYRGSRQDFTVWSTR